MDTAEVDELSRRDQPMMLRRPVPPRLQGLVARISGYCENGVALTNSVEMAPLTVPLVISFGEPFAIALDRPPASTDVHGSFASGLHPGYVLIGSTGRAACVQIDFTPLGARRFFRLPMSELASRMVALDDLAVAGATELRQRLGETEEWERRLDLVVEYLSIRFGGSQPDDDAVAQALGLIARSRGSLRIGDVAARIGWSRKHLNRRFNEEIGLGPKDIARMVRFNRALALARGRSAGWADIAFECGYADQAHMVREFRAFAGTTPSALAA